MTQMRDEDFRKVSLRDTEFNEMEKKRSKRSLEKEEVKSSSWDR